MRHLRFAGRGDRVQRAALMAIVRGSPMLMRTLRLAARMDLPDWWLVSGAIYNTVWNRLTGRPPLTGLRL